MLGEHWSSQVGEGRVAFVPPGVAFGGAGFARDCIEAIVAHDMARIFKVATGTVDPVIIVAAWRSMGPRRVVTAEETRKEAGRHQKKDAAA